MRQIILLFVTLLLLAACGRDESQLRAELQAIDSEMLQLRIAAEQHRAQMDAAEFDTFIASFAAGYGATSGDYELAGEGADSAFQSARQHDLSGYTIDQLKQRFEVLAARRAEIMAQLN